MFVQPTDDVEGVEREASSVVEVGTQQSAQRAYSHWSPLFHLVISNQVLRATGVEGTRWHQGNQRNSLGACLPPCPTTVHTLPTSGGHGQPQKGAETEKATTSHLGTFAQAIASIHLRPDRFVRAGVTGHSSPRHTRVLISSNDPRPEVSLQPFASNRLLVL